MQLDIKQYEKWLLIYYSPEKFQSSVSAIRYKGIIKSTSATTVSFLFQSSVSAIRYKAITFDLTHDEEISSFQSSVSAIRYKVRAMAQEQESAY